MKDRIEHALLSIRQTPTDEKELQLQIAQCFESAGIVFQREVATPSGPVDFVVGETAIEVKIKGSPLSVMRQVLRYLEDERFTSAIIVTTKPMVIPINQTQDGKSISVIELWKNFL